MTIAPIDIDTDKAQKPVYIETIIINRTPPADLTWPGIENWVSVAFDGLNGTLSAGEGTHNPLPPLYITATGARQLANALNRLAERIDTEGNRLA